MSIDWTALVAICMTFGTPISIVALRYRYKALELKSKNANNQEPKQLSAEEHRELEELREARKQLEARVQNLETIVCSVDLELNARLNRLASEQSRISLPAGGANAPQLPARPTDGGHPTLAAPLPGSISPGQVLAGRYTIERDLGHGGMGAVFLARDAQLAELVALKVISAHLLHDPAAASDRFRREASAARRVTHPNVIRIHDIGEAGGLLFLSMEFFDGLTLANLLGRRGAFPWEEARELLAQVLDGLGAAHRAGVVHRDLKPQNVLVNAARHVKLIDFGLAKSSYLEGMTATGMILGTPEYMAPEQIRGRPTDARTDLYAFGCLAYHLLTGAPPFRGETPIATSFAHCNQEPAPLRRLRPELNPEVEAVVLRCLSKDPAARFDSAEDTKRALLA